MSYLQVPQSPQLVALPLFWGWGCWGQCCCFQPPAAFGCVLIGGDSNSSFSKKQIKTKQKNKKWLSRPCAEMLKSW